MAKKKKVRPIPNVIVKTLALLAVCLHVYLSYLLVGTHINWFSIFTLTTSSVFLFQGLLLCYLCVKLHTNEFGHTFLVLVIKIVAIIFIQLSLEYSLVLPSKLLILLITVLWFVNFLLMYRILKTSSLRYDRLVLAYQRIFKKNKSHLNTIKSLTDDLEEHDADLTYRLGERNLELEIALRELSERNQELERLSAIDPLTGLMNRRYFDKRMLAETRRSKREQTPLGVALLDIDHFKHINDKYGHQCGDHCLQEFSKILQDEIKRPSDTICRYGGEEFVLILPNTDAEGLFQLLERIRTRLEKTIIYYQVNQFVMTVSIGGCSRVVREDSENHSLLGHVDKLLYEVKESGRNSTLVKPYNSTS